MLTFVYEIFALYIRTDDYIYKLVEYFVFKIRRKNYRYELKTSSQKINKLVLILKTDSAGSKYIENFKGVTVLFLAIICVRPK